ncbi:tetrapyrrole methylase [Rhizoctonia solani]|nr:tetrapyrrole methylase [Rhizoctonia solani]
MATFTEDNHPKRGSLIIAGSGIASVAHFTLETVSHLKNADKVFYLVNDPVTEAFIQENNPDTFDLVTFYSETKPRYHSYVEMAEIMLKEVRAGHKVLGIFYGHPGVFVHPSRRALFIARQENYEARMLPGISSEDYMFADLELDPAEFGCMTCEATELIARNRPLNTSVHNIIWQAGIVGVSTLEYQESKFQLLVDRLERDFGPEHKVVHYVGAIRMTPQAQSAMVVYSIQELRNPAVANFINSGSTLYVPPRLRDVPRVDPDSATALGLPPVTTGFLSASPTWVGSRFVTPSSYGDLENNIVAQMNENRSRSRITEPSPAMKGLMIKLAQELKLQEEYKKDPAKVAADTPDLKEIERRALSYGLDNTIRAVMSHRGSSSGPTEEQLKEISWEGSTIKHVTASSIAQ